MVASAVKVSVVIPAYNAREFLLRALESALGQTRMPDEVLVVDDGSTDGTAEIANGAGSPVRVIRQENGGAASARNRALSECTGDFIAFLDADDEWYPGHLERALAVFDRMPDLVWCCAAFERVSPIWPRHEARPNEARLADRTYFEDYFDMVRDFNNITPTMVIRRAVFDEVGVFDTELTTAEDIDLWFRIALAHPRVGYCPEFAVINHTQPGTLSRSGLYTGERAFEFINRCQDRAAAHSAEASRRAEPFIAKWARELVRTATLEVDRELLGRIASRYGNLLAPKWRVVGSLVQHLPRSLSLSAIRAWEALRPLRLGEPE